MADWGNLPKDIVAKIAEHLDFFEDFETVFKTCSRWRSAAKEAKFRDSCNNAHTHTLPWLLLPERYESSNIRRLYSLSKDMVRRISLPSDSARIKKKEKKKLLSSHGWLLVVSEKVNKLSLFNPFFSRPIIELPEINKIKIWSGNALFEIENYRWHNASLTKFILSADPSTTSDFVVFLTCEDGKYYPMSILLYWRNGDHGWTQVTDPLGVPDVEAGTGLIGLRENLRLDTGFLSKGCRGVTFYQGEFYGVDAFGLIVKFETSSLGDSFRTVTKLIDEATNGITWLYHLVESMGQLLVVRQVIDLMIDSACVNNYNTPNNLRKPPPTPIRIIRFEVLELDVNTGNVNQVPSLGNRAIFIGFNSSFSVDVSSSLAHGFKPNCIYYTEELRNPQWKGPKRGGKNHCLYNLNNGKFERCFYKGRSSHLGKLTQLMWVESPKSWSWS